MLICIVGTKAIEKIKTQTETVIVIALLFNASFNSFEYPLVTESMHFWKAP